MAEDGAGEPHPTMLTPHEIHHGVLLPAFLAAVFLLPALIPRLRQRAQYALLIGLTVSFLLSFMHLFDRPPLPPLELTGWLFYLAIVVFPVGLIIDIYGFRLLALPIFFLSTSLLLWPILQHHDSFGESATTISFIALAGFLSYLSLMQLSARVGGRSMHLILLLLTAASSQILLMSGSRTLGQFPLIVTAALAGALPLVWYLRIPLTSGPLLLILLLWHGFLIAGHFTATLTPLNALLLVIAPHLAWVAELRARHWPIPARLLLRFGAVLIPMLTAQLIAWRDFEQGMRELGY